MTFEQVATTLEALHERLRAVSGVSEVAFGNALPFVPTGGSSAFTVPSPRNPAVMLQIQTLHRTVSPTYFDAMGLRLIAGRGLNSGDTAGSTPVIMVNRSFAAQYLGENPVGQRLNFRGPGAGGGSTVGMGSRGIWEIVGVVEDMRQGGLDLGGVVVPTADAGQPEMFVSYRQLGESIPESVFLVVRTREDPSSLAPTLRALIREYAATLVLDSVMTMEDRLIASVAKPRTYTFVLVAFAIFALAITGAGLFGVLSYGVARRTREIGVRCALGAKPFDVAALVLRQAATIIVAGLLIGLISAGFLANSFAGVLYGIRPHDGISFILGPLLVALIGFVACLAPARRAIAIDPLRALRSE